VNKSTAIASADVALIKYWGKKDERLRLPENGSISIILNALTTTTTVDFRDDLTSDECFIDGDKVSDIQASRITEHLNRIRRITSQGTFARVVSNNSFPASTGLSSSGSGFAALTLAATHAVGLKLSEKQLSILARQGSGTACRCMCGGFVEWIDGNTSDSSYSHSLFPAEHWDLIDVVAIVNSQKKKVSSSLGHTSAQSSLLFKPRQQRIKQKIQEMKNAITKKDFTKLGVITESEALEFHSVLLTSSPPLVMWYPGTIAVILAVHELRSQGIEAYYTINTGFNVHVLTQPKNKNMVIKYVNQLPEVEKVIISKIGNKPIITTNHLL
jgi:diphosphomevalonate decarboxylase